MKLMYLMRTFTIMDEILSKVTAFKTVLSMNSNVTMHTIFSPRSHVFQKDQIMRKSADCHDAIEFFVLNFILSDYQLCTFIK